MRADNLELRREYMMWVFIENLQPRSQTKCKEKPCNCREEQLVKNPMEMALTFEEQQEGLGG